MTSPAKPVATRGVSRPIAGLVTFAGLGGYLIEWGRESLGRAAIHGSYVVTHGSPLEMRIAGWLMFLAGPVAAVYFGTDFRRAVAAVRAPGAAGMSRFAGRRRARTGHRARRPRTYWLKRLPLLVPLVAAATFVVPMGFVGGGPSNWAALPGGVDFLRGVKWSLLATFASGLLVIGTETLLLTEPKRGISIAASVAALMTPVAALAMTVYNW